MAVAVLVALALLTFAIPITTWRTGELPAPPLPVVSGGPAVTMPPRVWIDTDAACGDSRTTDPDDCFAIFLLARASGVEIAGISTVYGNASLDVSDSTTRALVAILQREGFDSPPVYRGSAGPWGEGGSVAPAPAHDALGRALADGPLTLLSLGPLTNVAAALRDRPDLQDSVERLVAVIGRRPGHLFHPAEGADGGILFGHGPVFRDFNFDKDRAAARVVLRMRLPTTLIPYEAARDVSLTEADLARMRAAGDAARWVAARANGWLDFWHDAIGREGFYPFDVLAAAYVLEPGFLDCARAAAWISEDRKLWKWIYEPEALLVGLERNRPADALATSSVVYCPRPSAELHSWLIARLAASDGEGVETSYLRRRAR